MIFKSGKQRSWLLKDVRGLLLGVLSLGMATTVLKALEFEQFLYNVALVYIIIVLLIASEYGLLPGIIISVLGFLCFNFFFIPPFYSLVIHSGAGVLAVIGFLIAAIITSQIAAHARRKTTEALLRQQETAALNELNMAVLTEAQSDLILTRIVQQVAHNLQALVTTIYLAPATKAGGELELKATYSKSITANNYFDIKLAYQSYNQQNARYFQPDAGLLAAYLPLQSGSVAIGVLAVLLKENSGKTQPPSFYEAHLERWLAILANQVAVAVEHARLIQETAQVASLKEADRLKSALLASVSHELRTPITAIKTAVEGLKFAPANIEPDEQKEYLEIIEQEADRLDLLISNLLDLSRLEAGTLRPDKGLHYLPEIINKTLERLARSSILASHPVSTSFEEDLPLLAVDYLQMEQIMTNLIENAAKYSPPERPITISIRKLVGQALDEQPGFSVHNARARADLPAWTGLQVQVADQGIGIPAAEIEHIFKKFYRASNSVKSILKRNVPGTGLGLTIARALVEGHNGYIWAASAPKDGSIISFWLPLPVDQPVQINV